MKQGYRERCIKGVITGLLLFALQAGAFAQYEDTTVTVDTSTDAEVSVTTYDTEEQSPRQEAGPPQEPPVFRAVPDSVIRNLQKKKEFAYANDPAYWKKEPVSSDSNDWLAWLISKEWFKYMVLTLLIGVLLFAIIRIAISNRMFMFTAGRKSADREEDELLQQENLASLVQEAEAQNNFRLAVRYRYMKVLQEMDERKIIALDARSTNWDYVSRMGSHPLKNQFLLLTRAYEYVWYGEFEINNDQYGYLRTEFQQFENSLSR
jgi:hypothetical protein